MMDKRVIKITVNNQPYEREVETRRSLGDFLRQDLGLTGTHYGCEHGVCGACTILLNGNTARSCLMLAVQADGFEVTTIEGLARPDGTFSELQQAFRECHGLQCGFCTPGMLTTLTELLNENLNPTEAEVRETITGNLCRCTGYQSIVNAALLAAGRMRAAKAGGASALAQEVKP
jgi:aerobic-type carbon monoxide dehydrogenase small subunit (CoxS/CutS family)